MFATTLKRGEIKIMTPNITQRIILDILYVGYSYVDLARIRISANVCTIQDRCFDGNLYLQEVRITSDNPTFNGKGHFSECYNLVMIHIYHNVNITRLPEEFLHSCRSLTSVRLTPSIQQIGSSCFRFCDSLELIDLSRLTLLTEIPEYCFRDCWSLKSVILPGSIVRLSKGCFSECESLSGVKIKGAVNIILGECCFHGCRSLSVLKLKIFVDVNRRTFQLSGLVSVNISHITLSADTVPDYLFAQCRCLSEVVLDKGASIIREGAFYFCDNLISVKGPTKLVLIDGESFGKCPRLRIIDGLCPETKLYKDSFGDCHFLPSYLKILVAADIDVGYYPREMIELSSMFIPFCPVCFSTFSYINTPYEYTHCGHIICKACLGFRCPACFT